MLIEEVQALSNVEKIAAALEKANPIFEMSDLVVAETTCDGKKKAYEIFMYEGAAHAFNTMQARLVRFIDERTRLLAAMSHDLKTPITRMRLRAELIEDTPLRDVRRVAIIGDAEDEEPRAGIVERLAYRVWRAFNRA